MTQRSYDAVVVGAGPNGFGAAITLAQAGRSVLLVERAETVGGGMRSAELTLPGFVHDVCSAVHPLAAASPFLQTLDLQAHGCELVFPPSAVAHPFDQGPSAVAHRDLAATAATLGEDGSAWRMLMGPLVDGADAILDTVLAPPALPRHGYRTLGRFGPLALLPAATLARRFFNGPRARALFAGMAAHSIQPLERSPTAGFGLVLGMLAHRYGWPLVRGGSQRLADALLSVFTALGGVIATGWEVTSLDELPPARAYLLDVTPRQLLSIAGDRLGRRYRRRLQRYRYGPGACKVDYALDGPVPWRDPACQSAATVHLGGTLEEISTSERDTAAGRHADRPFVLVVQPSGFDASRAPASRSTLWAYCHVPHGSTIDMTPAISRQIERFAPGFRDLVLASTTTTAAQMESYNPNYVGGDINGGVQDLTQLVTRPAARWPVYATTVEGVYLCSASTPPGGGVHGLCGVGAARAALRRELR